jgi:group II intron reverse transcriptase/maturase
MPRAALTTLAHYIDMEWLREAYRRTRKDGAPGVDGQGAADYGVHLEENLRELLDLAKSGRYKAPPVRRVRIPKGEGRETRPIGIPTFEDKVLQRAVAMVLEAVYEQDFLDCSWGFRPRRSAHQALESLWQQIMRMGGGWVVELDIRRFFDTVDHGKLREILRRRVRDGVVLRLIGKWLKAGALEEGRVIHPDTGTPQGGVISPLLANVYLHEVLDEWFEGEVRPTLQGAAFLIRYADDAILVFRREEDARRVMEELPKRFGEYGLQLHPEKTRLVGFRRSADRRRGERRRDGRGSFDFLGFTHFWGLSRKGNWVVKRKTARSRFSRAVRTVGEWCRRNRHLPVRDQHRALSQKLRGHYGYYGITGNSGALERFAFAVRRVWHKWLGRRSQRASMPWERFNRLLEHYPLPTPVVVHSIYRRVAKP